MKIYAPVKEANGIWASVRFVNGVGETDNPRLIEWFKANGYRVSGEVQPSMPPVEEPLKKCEEVIEELLENCDEPDFESMTPNELRDWAKSNGFGSVIKNTRNKEKLLELIRG